MGTSYDGYRLEIASKKRHVCCICGKHFGTTWLLNRHFRIHSGEKPYKCPYCEKAFTQKNHIKGHVQHIHAAQAGLPPFNNATGTGKATAAAAAAAVVASAHGARPSHPTQRALKSEPVAASAGASVFPERTSDLAITQFH